MKTIAKTLAFCALCASFLVTPVAQAASPEKTVRLAYVEWDCATATTNLAKTALESKGFQVEILSVSAAAMWMGLATGDIDGMLTAWLPVTHGDYLKKSQGKVVDLGPLVTGARLGLAVPSYVTVNSITELDAQAKKFSKRIVGIDPGAGIMRLAEQAIKDYALKSFYLEEGSGATMAAALQDAIGRKEWIVVTGWSPHWMFGRFELKYLDDPKGAFGKEEAIHAFARKNLKQDKPELYAFLDAFHYENIAQLQQLMEWNSAPKANLEKNSQRFMSEYPTLVESWFAAK